MSVITPISIFALVCFTLAGTGCGAAAKLETLYSFKGGTDGANPYAGVVAHGRYLYGTTYYGGAGGTGTVFKIDPNTGIETVVYSFSGAANVPNPNNPAALLTFKGNVIFGTTDNVSDSEGSYDGAIFKLDTRSGIATTLYEIPGTELTPAVPPNVNFIGHALYATSTQPGGSLFTINRKSGMRTTIYSFGGETSPNGSTPSSGVIEFNGLLYGTTYTGGSLQCGVFYAVDPIAHTETTLHSFGGTADGCIPTGPLAFQGGVFYGTTLQGGTGGTVYSVNAASGMATVLANLSEPATGVTVAGGGLFITGTNSLFQVDISTGVTTVLYQFTGGVDGKAPVPGLTYSNGVFYGATNGGGAHGFGTIFKLVP